jgi:hypothetical protein
LHFAHQDDRLRRSDEQLLLRRHADHLPTLGTELVEQLLDVAAGVDDSVLEQRIVTPPFASSSGIARGTASVAPRIQHQQFSATSRTKLAVASMRRLVRLLAAAIPGATARAVDGAGHAAPFA